MSHSAQSGAAPISLRSALNNLAVSTESESAFRTLQALTDFLGIGLACVRVQDGQILARTRTEEPFVLPRGVWADLAHADRLSLVELNGLTYFRLPLPQVAEENTCAVGFVASGSTPRPYDLVLAAAAADWTEERFHHWLSQRLTCTPLVLRKLLEALVEQTQATALEAATRREVDQLATQLEHTYEEICLLHALTQNLQISRTPVELAQMSLRRLHSMMPAAGHAIWLGDLSGKNDEEGYFFKAGDVPLDQPRVVELLQQCGDHDWSRPMVRNRLDDTRKLTAFPELKNVVVVAIAEGTRRFGWLLAMNLGDGADFSSIEARLLNSVANILGTHCGNLDLYRQQDELLLSFVRSLVSTLDAKDAYTRGHSERVALIARRLGEELGLNEQELRDIYLSGLLHDIGKIGVDDNILRKPGQLTESEFEQIQKHPGIGYGILAGIRHLHSVIPGVRHHHETFSGKGYPDGLAGEQIPLIARILAVADSYDAMGSDRPYRPGMPLEQLEIILRRGAGQQWDAKVIDAYFRVREEIREICASYTPENNNLLELSSSGTSCVMT